MTKWTFTNGDAVSGKIDRQSYRFSIPLVQNLDGGFTNVGVSTPMPVRGYQDIVAMGEVADVSQFTKFSWSGSLTAASGEEVIWPIPGTPKNVLLFIIAAGVWFPIVMGALR